MGWGVEEVDRKMERYMCGETYVWRGERDVERVERASGELGEYRGRWIWRWGVEEVDMKMERYMCGETSKYGGSLREI